MRKILFLFAVMVAVNFSPSETKVASAAPAGPDVYGYHYQANLFNGIYENFTRPAVPYTESPSGTTLQMKWNDPFMDENKVRHAGHVSYLDSGAWLTNHIGYYDDDGRWTVYFEKIVAAKSAWTLTAGTWYDEDGDVVGQEIWGEFYIAQETERGLLTKAPAGPGLGNN